MSAVLKPRVSLPLGEAARAYLAARAAHQDAAGQLLAAAIAFDAAEDALLYSFENNGADDTTGVFVDGTVLSIREEHWDLKPGDRIAVIKAEAV
jgi:hypothetical protein